MTEDSDSSHGSSYTPPKGRPTPTRDGRVRAARSTARRRGRRQWIAAIVIGVILFGLVIVFGSGTGGHRLEDGPGVGVHTN